MMKKASRCFWAIVEGIMENMELGRGKNMAKRMMRVMDMLERKQLDVDFVGLDMTKEWDGEFINLKFKIVPQYTEDSDTIVLESDSCTEAKLLAGDVPRLPRRT